jgi:hypothetical protein
MSGAGGQMSKRAQQRTERRERERSSSRSSASRFYVTETRRGDVVTWIVWDGSTAVAGPMERGDRAKAMARRLNEQAGLGGHVTVHHARPQLERPQPGEPLAPFVESVLDGAGLITGWCSRHPTPKALQIETTDSGSVVVRQIPWTARRPGQVFSEWYPPEQVEREELRRWRDTLARHGLTVVEDEDKSGHFLRVTPPVL